METTEQVKQPENKLLSAKHKTNRETHMTHDVQVGLLKRFKVEKTTLRLHLMNGEELIGIIRGYDTFAIDFLSDDGKTHLLYKHGIVGFSTAAVLAKAA